jgi:hypothetical protein
MKKNFGKKRAFLNPRTGVAAASYDVSLSFIDRKKHGPYMDVGASIQLADCDRKISLEFDLWESDPKAMVTELKARRQKLARLKEIIDGFVAATEAAYDTLEECLPEYEELINEAKKNKKNKK